MSLDLILRSPDYRVTVAFIDMENADTVFVGDVDILRDIEMRGMLDGLALIGVEICFDTADTDKSLFLLDQIQHGPDWFEKIRVNDLAVVHERVGKHELPFGRHDPFIVVPCHFFCHEQVMHNFEMRFGQEVFVYGNHGCQPARNDHGSQ